MRSRIWLLMLALGFLSACGGSAPSVSQVVISSGVANDSFKVGDAPTLTAAAKDSSGNTISGKTFTWASSNTAIATIDADGKLTPKQVGSVKISATADNIKGEKTITIYGLEVVGGVGKYSDVPANLYFNLAIRLVLPGGEANPEGAISITGPTGFNSNQALSITYPAQTKDGILRTDLTVPVSGSYQASTTSSGQTYQTTFTVNTSNILPYATNLQITAKSSTSVSGTWTAASGAANYTTGIQGSAGGATIKSISTLATNGTVGGLTLDTTKTYRFFVQATNFTNFETTLPAQYNTSYTFIPLSF